MLHSRDTPTGAPGTPVSDLILQARPDLEARMRPLFSRARTLEEETEQGQGEKRPAEVDVDALHQQSAKARGSDDPIPCVSPSEALQLEELDRRDPDRVKLKDHGT